MTTRIGIMGFGRIGRNVFRILYPRDDIEIVAIADVADPKALEYLLKFDTVHGRFQEPVWVTNGAMYAKGRQIRMLQRKAPGDVDWGAMGVDIVIEATGQFLAAKLRWPDALLGDLHALDALEAEEQFDEVRRRLGRDPLHDRPERLLHVLAEGDALDCEAAQVHLHALVRLKHARASRGSASHRKSERKAKTQLHRVPFFSARGVAWDMVGAAGRIGNAGIEEPAGGSSPRHHSSETSAARSMSAGRRRR